MRKINPMTSGVYDGFMYPNYTDSQHSMVKMWVPHSLMAQAEGLLRKVKDVLVFLVSNTLLFVVSAVSRRH